ncbi:MAG TPA: helix-turn-helix transcriptional regulator [Reyranella sp.]|jgi:transcriptional regulator with XRE-family HTH domain|nr:helix-turn-helix transcriptional regulator [Reyranella sp.]
MADYTGTKITTIDRSVRQQRTLGAFLRAHRARLSPAGLGLPAGQRRRTPGLRREEVAQRCGLSVTWYTWLEQGRDVAASPQALAAVAQALQLTPAERAYLFQIAGRVDPLANGESAVNVPPVLADALASISGPAYVLDRLWNARACNEAARLLFVGWLDGDDPNLLRYVFLNPVARRVIPDWNARARRVLAEFRAESSRHLDDPALVALADDLRARSDFFARCWDEHEVVVPQGGERTFEHPREGRLAYEQIAFTLASRVDLKLVMLIGRSRRASRRSRG